jgi:lipopolysaccharide/colanic/teichoic acid biosynthesis glycosyltransferase
VAIRPVAGLPLLHMERPELQGVRRWTKELFDRTAAAFGLLLLAPLLIGAAVAVKATSRGPVFFRQERIGRGGTPFTMLKFRSMVVGADAMVDDLLAESDGNGVLFKKKVDPRVTAVGRFLRRYSIDELPQLLNVLRGEMSLVGPRPDVLPLAKYQVWQRRRFDVEPGITGLWQVSGKNHTTFTTMIRLDIAYVRRRSFWLDVSILLRTIAAVLRN